VCAASSHLRSNRCEERGKRRHGRGGGRAPLLRHVHYVVQHLGAHASASMLEEENRSRRRDRHAHRDVRQSCCLLRGRGVDHPQLKPNHGSVDSGARGATRRQTCSPFAS
jgi:hypothetical protein